MVRKTMLIKLQGTPLDIGHKLLQHDPQSCPPLIAFHDNLSNSFFHLAHNLLFAFAGESLIAQLIVLRKGKVVRSAGRTGRALFGID